MRLGAWLTAQLYALVISEAKLIHGEACPDTGSRWFAAYLNRRSSGSRQRVLHHAHVQICTVGIHTAHALYIEIEAHRARQEQPGKRSHETACYNNQRMQSQTNRL